NSGTGSPTSARLDRAAKLDGFSLLDAPMDAKRQRDNRASGKDDSGRADSGQGSGKEKRADAGASGHVNGGTGEIARFHYMPTIAARMAVTVNGAPSGVAVIPISAMLSSMARAASSRVRWLRMQSRAR